MKYKQEMQNEGMNLYFSMYLKRYDEKWLLLPVYFTVKIKF